MVQVSENIRMFAASIDQADKTYSISARLFLCLDGSTVSINKDIRLSIPFMAIRTYWMNCLLGRRWEETAFLVSKHLKFIHNMTKQDEFCNAGNNSTYVPTSAHETCISSLKAKWLKPANTLASRKSFVSMFRELYPSIYRMKVKHTPYLFIVRADACGRELHAAAYTLERLAEKFHLLCNQRLGELS